LIAATISLDSWQTV